MDGESWRVEADDEWLAAHKSSNFAKFRDRLARLGLLGLGEAASGAAPALLGPMAGAPRRPQLKIGGKAYAVVRYAEHRISYTTVALDVRRCRRCGQRLVHVHRIMTIREDGTRREVGSVRACRRCKANSWLFFSRMPTVERARRRDRRVVL